MANHPDVPPGCPHFAWHDYDDGCGDTLIFWCSDPFWSHDHGEPWVISSGRERPALTLMQRRTVGATAHYWWARLAVDPNTPRRLDLERPDALYCREQAGEWLRWIDEEKGC